MVDAIFMTKGELKQLLEKQLNGALNLSEAARLKKWVEENNDESTLRCMEELWDEFQGDNKHNHYSDTLREELYRRIHPQINHRSAFRFVRYAAAVIVPLILMFGVYRFTRMSTINELSQNETQIETALGERARIVLPDGTRVLISGNSRLTYPATFNRGHRKVNLEGEAFFEVTKDKQHPFIVLSPEAQVKVMGTIFNIFAYPDESYFEASLQSGMVEVTSRKRPHHSIVLNQCEKVRMNYRDGILMKMPTNLRLETAWTRGELYFQSDSLKTIFKKIERFYGVSIHCDGPIPDEVFTAGYREREITQVLDNLQQHYPFTYQKRGNQLAIRFRKPSSQSKINKQ